MDLEQTHEAYKFLMWHLRWQHLSFKTCWLNNIDSHEFCLHFEQGATLGRICSSLNRVVGVKGGAP
jgi:hypothetical protein